VWNTVAMESFFSYSFRSIVVKVETMTEGAPLSAVIAGGRTISENLDRAVASGAVIEHPDGRYELAEWASGKPPVLDLFMRPLSRATSLPCAFLNRFLFRYAYAQATVPLGCAACYKVKVVSRSLRQLMAVKDLAEALPYPTKSGAEVDNPENSHPYGTYLYLDGLDQARAVYRTLREQIDTHRQLGPDVQMLIKRGCTNYERKCGPSDQYSFDPALEAVEAELSKRFIRPVQTLPPKFRNPFKLIEIIKIAYRIGDETYKDFTQGKNLVPPTVAYPPEP
jgi:hypothetical protein